jgi:hypothetical protein
MSLPVVVFRHALTALGAATAAVIVAHEIDRVIAAVRWQLRRSVPLPEGVFPRDVV